MSFKVFFFLFLALAASLFSGRNDFSNFGRRSPKEHFCEISLKSVLWSGKRCHLKVFLLLALAAILFSGAERFKQFWKRVTQGTFL